VLKNIKNDQKTSKNDQKHQKMTKKHQKLKLLNLENLFFFVITRLINLSISWDHM
tara:strand:- start:251 stop:415 length:165 start_codon:yes stop_codon:yes gene_type:complete